MAEIFDGASVTRVEASAGSLGIHKAQLSPEIQDMQRDIDRTRQFGEEGVRQQRREQQNHAGEPPAPPKPTGLQLAQAAEKDFNAAPDAAKAIGQFTPRFDEAMKQSREETREAARKASAAVKAMAGEYVSAQAGVAISNWLVKQAVASVDPQDLESVQGKVSAYKIAQQEQMQHTQEQIVAGLSKKYPQVADALKGETKAAGTLASVQQQEQGVWTKFETSMNSQLETEDIVVNALRKAGNGEAADTIHHDGMVALAQMHGIEGRYETAVTARAQMMYQAFLSRLQQGNHPPAEQRPGFDI